VGVTRGIKTSLPEENKNSADEEKPTKIELVPLGSYGYMELWKAYVIEFTACVTFMLIINYCNGFPIAAFLGLYVMLTVFYPVSGANMNACISLSLWYFEEEFFPVHYWRRFGYIFAVQPFSIFVGLMLSWGVVGPNLVFLDPPSTAPIRIAFCEFFWTGAVAFVALHCIVSRYTRPFKDIGLCFAFFICFLYFATIAGERVSGGIYNPTKYLVMQAVAYYRGVSPNAFQNWYCYVFPQFIGTIVFTCAFKYLWEPTYYRFMNLKFRWEDSFFPEKYIPEKSA
jgi:glycerol uptake facilitator-like aquaporin